MFEFLKKLFGFREKQVVPSSSLSQGTTTGTPANLRIDSIQQFFDTLEYRFVDSAAKKADMTFQYTVSGSNPIDFYIHVKDGSLNKYLGRADKSTAGILVDSDDYVQMINGDMNPRMAYLKGKMKLEGRKMAAQKLQKIILIGKDADRHYKKLSTSGKLADIVKQASAATDPVEAGQDTRPQLTESMTAPYQLTYKYHRSTGPVIGRFLTGLRDGRIEGTKTQDGRVIVPALEYDPETSATLDEFAEVSQSGTVTTWSWVNSPLPQHHQSTPFAWALVKLDGADTAMLHTVDVADESKMSTGMRVKIKWAEERIGRIQDIDCFVPEEEAA